MGKLEGIFGRFVFLLVASPLLIWLILKASVSSYLIYFLAIDYGLYSIFVGVKLRNNQKGAALLLGLYIFVGAFLIPFLVLMGFFLSGTEYPLFPSLSSAVSSSPPTSVGILFINYLVLEVIFAAVWCPFRRYTVPDCSKSGCRITKLCLKCGRNKSLPCGECKVVLIGLACIFLILFLCFFENFLISS